MILLHLSVSLVKAVFMRKFDWRFRVVTRPWYLIPYLEWERMTFAKNKTNYLFYE